MAANSFCYVTLYVVCSRIKEERTKSFLIKKRYFNIFSIRELQTQTEDEKREREGESESERGRKMKGKFCNNKKENLVRSLTLYCWLLVAFFPSNRKRQKGEKLCVMCVDVDGIGE
jgi:superfamily II DNA or RNA helicase